MMCCGGGELGRKEREEERREGPGHVIIAVDPPMEINTENEFGNV
jgi:hypothetical protein